MHTHTSMLCVCICMLPLYKQNKQHSKYIRIGDCSTNLLLLGALVACIVSVRTQVFVKTLLQSMHDFNECLPLFPTLGEPITAIFNSVNVDFLRRMPRVVISRFCNSPVYGVNRWEMLYIYVSISIAIAMAMAISIRIYTYVCIM